MSSAPSSPTTGRRESHTRWDKVVVHGCDRKIALLAERQHGVVATRQLGALGLSRNAIAARAAAGRLHRIHRGVYAVGHPVLPRYARWMAAVLAAGPGAVLSHASAAALWEIRPSQAARIDVSVRSGGGRTKRPGLRLHRATHLPTDETTRHHAIPVTTPARTLLDLAASLPRRALERALEHIAGTTLTKSELEERMLALCRTHGLEQPKINQEVAGLEVDFLLAAQRLVVEADSWRFHRTRAAFERDRQRDAILARAGYRTLRVTDRQLKRRPSEVVAAIAAPALRSSA